MNQTEIIENRIDELMFVLSSIDQSTNQGRQRAQEIEKLIMVSSEFLRELTGAPLQ